MFTSVGTICMKRLTPVFLFINQIGNDFTVVNVCRCDLIAGNQFCFVIGLYMILIAEVVSAVFFSPTGRPYLFDEAYAHSSHQAAHHF